MGLPTRAQEENAGIEVHRGAFPEARDVAYIHGGSGAPSSHREVKRLTREVCAALPSVGSQVTLKWSHVPITFKQEDHPDRNSGVGTLPLVASPIINNVVVSKMLIDGGSSINLISTKLMSKLQITEACLAPTGPFQGINLGTTQPLGKISLLVTFGTKENYRTGNIIFDVADIAMPYNGILGRPALAKFMAVIHHAYNSLKIPSYWGGDDRND